MDSVKLAWPKAVIFDWDNTLVDTWPVIHDAMEKTFTHYQLVPWTLDEIRTRVVHSMRDSFPKLFGEKWEEAGKLYQGFYQSNHLNTLQVLPMSEEVLKLLQEKGVYVAVVSNKKGPTLRKEITHLGWDKYFTKIIGSGDAPNDKPHPDPVHMALEGSGIKAGKDVWFVGDTVVDLEVAKNTGCVPVLYGQVESEVVNEQLRRYQSFDVHHHSHTHEAFLLYLRSLIG
ncbi:MAG: HAD family hydrolase [Alphaproteobacteria bacterium]|nr:HAD family hydrolase [Alphaproteobacteria bacterium]